MSTEYIKTNWQDGDIITADKMNNIENGIKDVEEAANTLKKDITKIEDEALIYVESDNKCDPSAITVGKAISDSNGAEYNQSNVSATDYISVQQGDIVYFCAVKADGSFLYAAYSNSFYEYSQKDPSGYLAHGNYTNGYVISNSNTKYVRSTFTNNGSFNNARILCLTLNGRPSNASDVPTYFTPFYKNPYTDIDTIYGEIGQLKDKYKSSIKNRVAYGFDTTTKLPNWNDNTNYEELTFKVPAFGTIEFPLSTGDAFVCFAMYANGTVGYVFQTKGSATTISEIGFTRTSEGCTIDCKIFRKYCTYLSLTYKTSQDWYINSISSYVPDWIGVDAINNNYASGVGFVLPSKAVMCGGIEMNIYYQNILRYINAENCHMIQPSDSYFEGFKDFARAKPNAGVTATKTLAFNLYGHDTNNVSIRSNNIDVKIIPNTSGNGLTKKVLLIGDSLTDANVFPRELVSMFDNDVMNVEFIGTRHTDTCPNEGYAGWRAFTFDKCATNTDDWETWGGTPPTELINPFYNANTQKFDFSKYMSDNDFDGVDYVFICLGTNDLARGNYDTDANLLEYYTDIVNSIHDYNINIRIGIWLPPTRALYANCTRQGIDFALRMNEFFIKNFDGQESSNIYLIPVYFNVDPYHDYPYQSKNVSDRNTSFQMNYCTDKLHLANAGYYKLADVIYCYIKFFGSLDA